ncbi:MAG: cyclic nucleotide-binding domain-containing protein [Candidatus Binatia bacterium]|nr:cyclic nucleotide-binding domain-containing protein [Candidatus Binatia bacterium]
MARVAKNGPDDTQARAWFDRTYPRADSFDSAQLLPEGVFLELLGERIASDPLHSVGLLHGLDKGESERFLAKTTVVEAQPGGHIVRQGELGETLFVVSNGACEVLGDEAPEHALSFLGSGDPFGKIGFLTEGRRTANVIARTPCGVVVLSAGFLRAFLNREPTVAAKVLLNL